MTKAKDQRSQSMKEQAYNVDRDKDHKSSTTKAISLISRRSVTMNSLRGRFRVVEGIGLDGFVDDMRRSYDEGIIGVDLVGCVDLLVDVNCGYASSLVIHLFLYPVIIS
ncbi:hypothetical protein Tco_1149271 [Tanacetum coccineum]